MATFRLSLHSIPAKVFNCLTGDAIKILRPMLDIFNVRKEVISLEYAHITPSLNYLSEKSGIDYYAGSRAIRCLKENGILRSRQIRTASGEYKTNIYTLGPVLKGVWQTFTDKIKGNKNHRLHQNANVVSKEQHKDNYFGHFVEYLRGLTGKKHIDVSNLNNRRL